MEHLFAFERQFQKRVYDAGLRHVHGKFIRQEASGTTAFDVYTPKEAPVARIMLLHGGGNEARFPLLHIAEFFLQKRYEVFLFDLDGHGVRSSTILCAKTFAHCVLDAEQAFAEHSAASLAPLFLYGFSMGGVFAWHAMTNGSKCKAAAIVAAPIVLNLNRAIVLKEATNLLICPPLNAVRWYGVREFMPAVGHFRRAVFPVRVRSKATNSMREFRRIVALSMIAKAPTPAAPSLWLYGTRDPIAAADEAREFANRKTNAQFEPLSNFGHSRIMWSLLPAQRSFAFFESERAKVAS